MKQLLSFFLLLLPYLALAQYPSNGNQKITLGEQTTADGLVFRGYATTDTVAATSKITRANKQDTSAFLLLDTVTNLLWHYKIGSNGWSQAGGSTFDTTTLNLVSRFAAKLNISDTASMLTNYYRSGRTGIIQASDVPTLNQNTTGSAATLTTSRTFQTNLASTSTASFNGSANVTPGVTGTLPVANGGTGASVKIFVDTINTQIINGKKTFTDTVIVNKGIRFPATQSASTNVNTLDDYEEGAFSVQLKFGGNNTGYTFYGNGGVFGKYTKIGDVVCVTIMVGLLSKAAGASTGNATITGLPFTSASNGVNLGGGINISNAISIDGASFYMTSNSTTLVLQNGNGLNLTDANFDSFLGEIHMNFVYQVN